MAFAKFKNFICMDYWYLNIKNGLFAVGGQLKVYILNVKGLSEFSNNVSPLDHTTRKAQT